MKSVIALIALSFVLNSFSFGQDYITQVKPQDKGEWGYMNIKGDIIVSPQYAKCFKFSEDGYAPIYKDKKFFFINAQGEQLSTELSNFRLIEGGFGMGLYGFSDGLAAVRVDKKWGYMDTNGKVIIELKYDNASAFDNGYALVKKGKSFFVINKNGEETKIEDSGVYEVKHFTEGLAPFYKKDKKHGFINTDGKVVIPAQFSGVGYFEGGLAWAKNKDKKVGYIDTSGEWIIRPNFLAAKDFDPVSGLARIKDESGWAYVNKAGDIKNIDTETFGDFNDGLALGKKNGKVGFFNSTGEWVIEPKFEAGRGFKNGYAAAKMNGQWGFINKAGEWVIEPKLAGVKDMELVK